MIRTYSNHSTWIYLRFVFCIFVAGLTLYLYIDRHNKLTELRIVIPQVSREVNMIREENTRLRYEIERFESPIHLMELLRKPEFSHLRYPYLNEVVVVPQDILGKEMNHE